MALVLRNAQESATRGQREMPQETLEYVDPSILDMPTFGDEGEYVYRWLRVQIRGEDDNQNISRRLRQGWQFVSEENLPANYIYQPFALQTSKILSGVVRNGDLVLGKLPREKAEAYNRFIKQQNDAMANKYRKRTVRDEESGQELQNESKESITYRGRTAKFSEN